MSLKSMKKYPQ
jgi:hypothetical protein